MNERNRRGFKYYFILGVSVALITVIWDYFWNEEFEILKYIFFAVAIGIYTWIFEIAIRKIGLLLEPLLKKRQAQSMDDFRK